MSAPEILNLSWDDIYNDADLLVKKLGNPDQWKGIIAITRGGMIPACLVAEKTGIRTLDTLSVSSYTHDNQSQLDILKPTGVTDDGEGWLVIDDLSDTGNTFRAIRNMLPKAYFATLHVKPAGRDAVDCWVKDYDQSCWIVYPWEVGAIN